MSKKVSNLLVECGKPLMFKVANADEIGLQPPPQRLGEDLRTIVNSMTIFQKEALVTSARTGVTWRRAS